MINIAVYLKATQDLRAAFVKRPSCETGQLLQYLPWLSGMYCVAIIRSENLDVFSLGLSQEALLPDAL
jgi:hypothetical protein